MNAGKYSYGIYLLHPFALAIMLENYRNYNSEIVRVSFTVIITYWLGKMFYYIVEFPIVKVSNHVCAIASKKLNAGDERISF